MQFIQTHAYLVYNQSLPGSGRERSPSPGLHQQGTDSKRMIADRADTRRWSCDSSTLEAGGHQPGGGHLQRSVRRNMDFQQQLSDMSRSPKEAVIGQHFWQLALGLPRDSIVFNLALGNLASMAAEQKQGAQPMHFWYWSNSHISASQLVWALPTGQSPVTVLAVRQETLSLLSKVDHFEDRSAQANAERYLIGTQDGRLLLLDSHSGYEIATHQLEDEKAEVKHAVFIDNDTQCLCCDSNGTITIFGIPQKEVDVYSDAFAALSIENGVGAQGNSFHSAISPTVEVGDESDEEDFEESSLEYEDPVAHSPAASFFSNSPPTGRAFCSPNSSRPCSPTQKPTVLGTFEQRGRTCLAKRSSDNNLQADSVRSLLYSPYKINHS
ncbi:wD repeat domain [Cichlidogyrus casuarinus]|uniref:WD repeat domain n=1 Tax=Cichlidogyrus casuarinus TaxID=1844966 RepID=A0ABD2QP45_9PLAT